MDEDEVNFEISEDNPEVRLGYASSENITMTGTWGTGISRNEWQTYSDKEKDRVCEEAMYELLEVYELSDDEVNEY